MGAAPELADALELPAAGGPFGRTTGSFTTGTAAVSDFAVGAGAVGGLTDTHAFFAAFRAVPAGHCGGGAATATVDATLVAAANAIDVRSAGARRAPKSLTGRPGCADFMQNLLEFAFVLRRVAALIASKCDFNPLLRTRGP